MNNLSNRLKELRASLKLTQKDVSQALKLSVTCYAGYEQGYRFPDLDTLNKISNFYKVSIDYLVGNSDDFGNVVSAQSNLTERESRLLKAFGTLSALEQDKLIADAEFYSMRHRSKFETIKK